MHELSIVSSIVESVTETLAAHPGARVKEARLRVGALALVIEDSLRFCYGIATEDKPLKSSKLVVKILPVLGFCGKCAQDVEIPSLQSFRCPPRRSALTPRSGLEFPKKSAASISSSMAELRLLRCLESPCRIAPLHTSSRILPWSIRFMRNPRRSKNTNESYCL